MFCIAKKVMIEGCKTTSASEFKRVGESKGNLLGEGLIMIVLDLPNKQSATQNEVLKLTEPAPYCLIKFVIADGWEDFTSVHTIEFA
jgi:hypothetical protein